MSRLSLAQASPPPAAGDRATAALKGRPIIAQGVALRIRDARAAQP
ncbi:MAG: hypothetical protein LBF90_07355 [Prevotellaceae bacterium]|nr:hypothetical protein [Prevotellaceae bacterium]